MKKALSVAVAAALALSMVSCGSTSTEPAPAPTPAPQQPVVEEPVEEEPEPEPEFVYMEPVVISGTGDDVVELDIPDGVTWYANVEGNAAAKHFSVTAYSENMEYVDLLVNTTDPYSGNVIDMSMETVLLEVNATGDWIITIKDTLDIPGVYQGDTITGNSDDVLWIESCGKTAHISGNADAHHFAVKTYGSKYDELLVNTVDPYEGTVMLQGEPYLFVISAESEWRIEL